jgi:mono/diheme cytochrome c family protein
LLLAGGLCIGARAQEARHSQDGHDHAQQNQNQQKQDQQKGQSQQDQQLPDGPGKEATERVCSACHGAEIVLGRGLTRDGWTQVVSDMVQRGAQGSEEDFTQIVEYLAANFPPKSDSGTKSATK